MPPGRENSPISDSDGILYSYFSQNATPFPQKTAVFVDGSGGNGKVHIWGADGGGFSVEYGKRAKRPGAPIGPQRDRPRHIIPYFRSGGGKPPPYR